MPKPLCFWVCANYQAEVAAVLRQEAWPDVALHASAPLCQNQSATSPVSGAALLPPPADCSQVCLVSGCLPARSAADNRQDWQIQVVEQCFHLLAAPEWVNQLLKNGAYLVSPGWLKHWPQHLAEWGFDQATARAFFHESTQQLVLLDTRLDPGSPTQIEALAGYLDLPFQIWEVGLSYLQKNLQALYHAWQTAQARASADRQTADYALAFDWLPHLAALQTEQEVAEELSQFFAMLFAPRQVGYRPLGAGPADTGGLGQALVTPEAALAAWLATHESFAWAADEQGFLLRLPYQAETVGVVEIDGLAFPAYREHYLKLALALAPVGGLAIANARAYQAVQRLNADLEQRVTERQQKPLAILQASAQQLLNLMTDVLDYTALEAGPLPLRLAAMPVQEACLASLRAVQVEAHARQVQLAFSLAPDISTVPADRLRLEQILTKLLDNGIKFTPKGGMVGLAVSGDAARQEVYFTVWDTGIGIAPKDQARIFEPFEQVDSRLAREYEGAGLGLALVRRLTELHGGRVTVDSAGADRGSRFTVALPCKPPLTD